MQPFRARLRILFSIVVPRRLRIQFTIVVPGRRRIYFSIVVPGRYRKQNMYRAQLLQAADRKRPWIILLPAAGSNVLFLPSYCASICYRRQAALYLSSPVVPETAAKSR